MNKQTLTPKVIPVLTCLVTLRYHSRTGFITRRIGRKDHLSRRTGWLNQNGYRQITVNGKTYAEHRIAWAMITGTDPGIMQVDHIDRNRSNNAVVNLRLATRSQNQLNSNCKGWTYFIGRNKPYRVRLVVRGVCVYLRYYATAKEAEEAYRLAKLKSTLG